MSARAAALVTEDSGAEGSGPAASWAHPVKAVRAKVRVRANAANRFLFFIINTPFLFVFLGFLLVMEKEYEGWF